MISFRPLPALETLEQLFLYDANTGILRRKIATERRPAGAIIDTPSHNGAYLKVKIGQTNCLVHRLIWKLYYKIEPNQIDHINGNGLDNRIANLREATQKENMQNRCISSNNTSGFIGIRYEESRDRWLVRLGYRNIGRFTTKAEAIKARITAEIEEGYHKNHGRKQQSGCVKTSALPANIEDLF